MQITISERDQENKVTLSFQTEKGKAKEAYSRTLRRLSKDLTIKGFRKGKVPSKIAEQHFGPEYIKAETLDNKFLSDLFEEVFKAKGLKVLHITTVQKVEFNDPEDSISIEAVVELFPEIELPDYTQWSVDVKIPKYEPEDQLKKTLDKILSESSSFQESSEAIEMGDEVVFDFDGKFQKEDGSWEAKPGMKSESYQIIIESGRFIENFLEQMVGMKTGEEKELDVNFPEGYHDSELSGRPAKFHVKIHKVSKPSKQTLDDSFAQRLGYESAEMLESKIKEEIERINKNNTRAQAGEVIINKLIDDVEINISKSMIDREFESELNTLQRSNYWSDEQTEEFKSSLNMESELKAAEKKIRRSVILTTLINELKLEATEEEIQQAFQKLNLPPNFEIPKANLPAIVGRLNLEVLTQKAVDHLIDSVKVNYQEMPIEEFEKEFGHVHGPHCNH
jgi:trigger factor